MSRILSLGGVLALWGNHVAASGAQATSRPGQACHCAEIACGYVLRRLEVPHTEEQLAHLAHAPAEAVALDKLAQFFREKGLEAITRRLSPSSLGKVGGAVILAVQPSGFGTHFEALVSVYPDRAFFASAYRPTGPRVVKRNWDQLANMWDGWALVVAHKKANEVDVLKSTLIVLLFAAGLAAGWLGVHLVRRRLLR